MSGTAKPPQSAQRLLRLLPLGDRRPEVEADLLELYSLRARNRGQRYARRRYYLDVISLWSRPGMRTDHESSRTGRGRVLAEIAQDLTYALRLLRRSPGVVGVTVLGLGVAIGVSTSVFSMLNAVAFRPTGIVDPASTVRILRKHQHGIRGLMPSTFGSATARRTPRSRPRCATRRRSARRLSVQMRRRQA